MNLKEYIQGHRQGKEANKFERQAMNDPFLQDAIDGFDTINGEHMIDIQNLEKEIGKRIRQKSKSGKNRWFTISIAASIALLIGIGSLILLNVNTDFNEPVIAQSDIKEDSGIMYEDEIILSDPSIAEEKIISVKKESLEKTSSKPAIGSVTAHTISSATKAHKEGFEINGDSANKNIIEKDIFKQEMISSTPPVIPIEKKPIENKLAGQFPKQSDDISSQLSGTLEGVAVQPVLSKQRLIYGKITGERGEPIPGANIKLEGTTIGTITDMDGKYSLNIPNDNNDKLVATYLGYETKELAIKDSVDIQLEPSYLALDEVVVVGYGKTKKKSFTGGVTNIDTDIFEEKEFKAYFEENRQKDICKGEKASLRACFTIDKNGTPTNIKIQKSNCKELEEEVIEMLEAGPEWSKTGKKIILNIEIN